MSCSRCMLCSGACLVHMKLVPAELLAALCTTVCLGSPLLVDFASTVALAGHHDGRPASGEYDCIWCRGFRMGTKEVEHGTCAVLFCKMERRGKQIPDRAPSHRKSCLPRNFVFSADAASFGCQLCDCLVAVRSAAEVVIHYVVHEGGADET